MSVAGWQGHHGKEKQREKEIWDHATCSSQWPWPNGQGVGLLIRRLRVRVPQGVLLVGGRAGLTSMPDLAHFLSALGWRWADDTSQPMVSGAASGVFLALAAEVAEKLPDGQVVQYRALWVVVRKRAFAGKWSHAGLNRGPYGY